MTCTVLNAMIISWYKNGHRLSKKHVQIREKHSCTIVFDRISQNDAGNYTCVGSRYGTKSTAFKVLLVGKYCIFLKLM